MCSGSFVTCLPNKLVTASAVISAAPNVCVVCLWTCVCIANFLDLAPKNAESFQVRENTQMGQNCSVNICAIFPCLGSKLTSKCIQHLASSNNICPNFQNLCITTCKNTYSIKEKINMSYYLRWHTVYLRSIVYGLIKALQESELCFHCMGNWDIQCIQGVSMNIYGKNIPKWNIILS